MGEPKRYGLIIPAKKNTKKPMIKKPAVFGDDSSDDEERAHREVNLSLIQESQKKKQMKQTQIEIQKALKEDPTVYEYDAVYDKMEEKKKAASVKVPEKDKKVPYAYVQKLKSSRNLILFNLILLTVYNYFNIHDFGVQIVEVISAPLHLTITDVIIICQVKKRKDMSQKFIPKSTPLSLLVNGSRFCV